MRTRLLVLALTLGFFALALATVAGLVAAAVWAFAEDVPGRGYIAAVLGLAAWAVVKAIRPRRFLVRDEGVLVPDGSPLRALAPEVDELRIVLGPQAYAKQWRGVRTVALGLPLVAALDREALRGVATHELAHHEAGDTRPDRLLLHARASLMRLTDVEHGLFALPFLLYARAFFAVTASIARDAERRADRLAAAAVGDAAYARALAALPRVDAAWTVFWTDRVMPALRAGARPPLAAGFRACLAEPDVRQVVEEAPDGGELHDRYALHPRLRERIAAAGGTAEDWPRGGDDALVAELAALEHGLLAGVAGEELAAALQPVSWDDLAAERPRVADAPRAPRLRPFAARLVEPPRTRAGAVFALAVIAAAFAPLTGLFVVIATRDGLEAGTQGYAMVWSLAIATALAGVLLARPHLAKLGRDGRVRVDADRLVIEQPRILKAPYAIPLDRIRAVAVDADGDERFEVHPDSPWDHPEEGGGDPLGHLWDRRKGAVLPLFDVTSDPPNVAVLLDAPVEGPTVRRRRVHGPLRDAHLAGLLLRVDDPEALRRSGAGTELRISDLRALDDG